MIILTNINHRVDCINLLENLSFTHNDVHDISRLVKGLNEGLSTEDLAIYNDIHDIDEMSAAFMTKPELVKETNGSGVKIVWQGHEYRYVSPDMDSNTLLRKAIGMWNHAGGGYQLLNWLKKNALCYYGCKNPQGKNLVESVIIDANKIPSSSIDDLVVGPNMYNQRMRGLTNECNDYDSLKSQLKELVDQGYSKVDNSNYDKYRSKLEEFTEYCRRNDYSSNMDEVTQASAIPPVTTDISKNFYLLGGYKLGEALGIQTSDDTTDKTTEDLLKSHDSVHSTEVQSGGEINESVINTNKTGMSYYDNFLNDKDHDYMKLTRGVQGRIVKMSPDEYISRIANDIFKVPVNTVVSQASEDSIDKYASMMKSGVKFNLPYINYADEGQEGRHRALAAKKVGEKEIPVLIVTKYDRNKELGIPNKSSIKLMYGNTIEWTDKSGHNHHESIGLDVSKLKSRIDQIVKSKDYV